MIRELIVTVNKRQFGERDIHVQPIKKKIVPGQDESGEGEEKTSRRRYKAPGRLKVRP